MAGFSTKQRLQRLAPFLNAADLRTMDQDVCASILLFLQSYTVLESSVAFIFRWSLNNERWL